MIASWLEANKIFFEVAASILFGSASILVGLASYRVYKQQLLTSQVQFRAHFSVQSRHIPDEKSDHVRQIDFLVFNYGAPAYNIIVEHKSLLKVFWYKETAKQEFIIPMVHYLFGQYLTGAPEGLIVTISGNSNRKKYIALRNNLSSTVGFDVFFSPITIISVTSENRLGEQVVEHFLGDSKVDKGLIDSYLTLLKKGPGVSLDSEDAIEILKDKIEKET